MSTSTERQLFRETVAQIAQKAREKLPECNGRVEKAVALVLHGDVEVRADGTTAVYSSTDPTRRYEVIAGACVCRDWQQAPHHFCQHRIAAGIAKRVRELLPIEPTPPAPAVPVLEAPASGPGHAGEPMFSLTLKGRLGTCEDVLLTVRGWSGAEFHANLAAVKGLLDAKAQTPTPPEAHWCALHSTAMPQTTKDGPSWYSHRLASGQWCKGR